MFRPRTRAARGGALVSVVISSAVFAAAASAAGYTARVFASGARITHSTPKGRAAISQPDDITLLGGHIFVGFQNGVGPQGQPSTTGNRDSTIVEFSINGKKLAQWDVVGKCDGLGADPLTGRVIATVNEDANSSLYAIEPGAGSRPVHYRYNKPLPSDGGTDSVVEYRGMLLVSASAPGTTGKSAPRASYPAVYRVSLDAATHVATIKPLFGDEAAAKSVGSGQTVHLALTDPDSSETVPAYAHRFAGDFMLTSQGDEEQIFVSGAGDPGQSLSVLKLTASVDDTAWPSGPTGTIYTTDNGANHIVKITGPFQRGSELAAVTPCDENSAPSTCPASGFPANYLGKINPATGAITPVALGGVTVHPQGMLFIP